MSGPNDTITNDTLGVSFYSTEENITSNEQAVTLRIDGTKNEPEG